MTHVPYTILSVGGSIIIPTTGFNIPFLVEFKKMILEEVESGHRVIMVVGGGGTARQYQNGLRGVGVTDSDTLDRIGIQTTMLNAEFVRMLFGDYAHKEVIHDPRKKVRTKAPIILASGWKPGCSTDTSTVRFAKTYHVTHAYNLSNIDYLFDQDPKENPSAQAIDRISWTEYREKYAPSEWSPGVSAPFDPVASALAQKMKLTVGVLRGTNLEEVRKALRGEGFKGTIIHP